MAFKEINRGGAHVDTGNPSNPNAELAQQQAAEALGLTVDGHILPGESWVPKEKAEKAAE